MGPIGHALFAGTAGTVVWALSDSPEAIPVAIATGVLVDVDHVFEVLAPRSARFSGLTLRFLHGWEYGIISLALVLAIGLEPLFMAAVLGYLSHLFLDQISNRKHLLYYFVVFRALRQLHRRRAARESNRSKAFGVSSVNRPLWGRMEPQLWRIFGSSK